MSGTTTKLALYLPGGGLSGLITPDEQVDIDKINDNMKKIDAAIGFVVCTSGTRPATPFTGQSIIESDTRNTMYWSGARWVPLDTVPNAASPAIRDVLYPTPVAGNSVLRTDKGRVDQYFALGAGGRTTAGWYQISGNPEVGILTAASGVTLTTYSLIKDNGKVLLEATTAVASISTAKLLTTVPAGFRPIQQSRSSAGIVNPSDIPTASVVQVLPTGEVYAYSNPAGTTGAIFSLAYRAVDTPVSD